MTTWDYCWIGPIKYGGHQFVGDYATLTLLTSEGCQARHIRPEGKTSEIDMIARTVATMGAEGWEMVGAVPTSNNTHLLYFKRPRS